MVELSETQKHEDMDDHPPSAMAYTSARSSVSKQLSKRPCPLLSVGQSEPSPSQLATTVDKSEKPDLEKQVIELRADRLNCDALRRLLKSRGHVTSGRKESLVARVVELFDNKDDIVDPGVAPKRARTISRREDLLEPEETCEPCRGEETCN